MRLVQLYDQIELVDKDRKFLHNWSITTTVRGGVSLKLHREQEVRA